MSEVFIILITGGIVVYAYLLGNYKGYCEGLEDAKTSIKEAIGIEKEGR